MSQLPAQPQPYPRNQHPQGFGPDGLGIVTVSGVPDFPALRRRLLPLAAALAALPDGVKSQLEDAASNYNVGWSHGKEALEGGRPDRLKGSFYANPCRDTYDDRAASDVEKYRWGRPGWVGGRLAGLGCGACGEQDGARSVVLC